MSTNKHLYTYIYITTMGFGQVVIGPPGSGIIYTFLFIIKREARNNNNINNINTIIIFKYIFI